MAEALVAGGLLLLVSGLFFSTLTPLIRKEDWFRENDSLTRSLLIARRKLQSRLTGSLLPVEQNEDALVTFFPKNRTATESLGDLAAIDIREMTTHAQDTPYLVTLDGEQRVVCLDNMGATLSIIWALGADGDASAQVAEDGRSVDFSFEGKLAESGAAWSYDLRIFVK